ncbi:carboxymuconolactone decarboxylase family protein [Shewanella loihica]|uniref:Alkylhydroperoxidase like protein, AhpD family n=1 Tax=Shewanella loihica (strain ATCC BAA-1088 / PV-4) TaxID=323850 RepID=A3QGK6_SHELP|nr:carboxymuconolactone decarboxylase family protein [Shewanella loihica]ABO24604.1 alkylhydroperoxidase like protein, AhpD family [Shewanella loihica PV-4]
MSTSIDYMTLAPEALGILYSQENYLKQVFSDHEKLGLAELELLKLHISQVNGCAFCIEMHTKLALELGVSLDKIVGLSAWRGLPYYSEAEREALAWAEQLALPHISIEAREQARRYFGDKLLVDLTLGINAINSWNRLCKALKPSLI